MPLLMENVDKIYWDSLAENPAAIELLEKNRDKIDWKWFTLNPAIWSPQGGPNGSRLLDWIDVDKLDWTLLCKNPKSIYLMENYKCNEEQLLSQQHPGEMNNALQLLLLFPA